MSSGVRPVLALGRSKGCDVDRTQVARLLQAEGGEWVLVEGNPEACSLLPRQSAPAWRLTPLHGGVGLPPAGSPTPSRLGGGPPAASAGGHQQHRPGIPVKRPKRMLVLVGLGYVAKVGLAESGVPGWGYVTISGRHPGLQGRDPETKATAAVSPGPARLPQEAGPRA